MQQRRAGEREEIKHAQPRGDGRNVAHPVFAARDINALHDAHAPIRLLPEYTALLNVDQRSVFDPHG